MYVGKHMVYLDIPGDVEADSEDESRTPFRITVFVTIVIHSVDEYVHYITYSGVLCVV